MDYQTVEAGNSFLVGDFFPLRPLSPGDTKKLDREIFAEVDWATTLVESLPIFFFES